MEYDQQPMYQDMFAASYNYSVQGTEGYLAAVFNHKAVRRAYTAPRYRPKMN